MPKSKGHSGVLEKKSILEEGSSWPSKTGICRAGNLDLARVANVPFVHNVMLTCLGVLFVCLFVCVLRLLV